MSSTRSDPEGDFLGFGWVKGPSAFRTLAEEALATSEAAEAALVPADEGTALAPLLAGDESLVVASQEVTMHYLTITRAALAKISSQPRP